MESHHWIMMDGQNNRRRKLRLVAEAERMGTTVTQGGGVGNVME